MPRIRSLASRVSTVIGLAPPSEHLPENDVGPAHGRPARSSCWVGSARYGLLQSAGLHGSTEPSFMPANAASTLAWMAGVMTLARSWYGEMPMPGGFDFASLVMTPPLSVPAPMRWM